jgi:hypothetical protein
VPRHSGSSTGHVTRKDLGIISTSRIHPSKTSQLWARRAQVERRYLVVSNLKALSGILWSGAGDRASSLKRLSESRPMSNASMDRSIIQPETSESLVVLFQSSTTGMLSILQSPDGVAAGDSQGCGRSTTSATSRSICVTTAL